MACIVDLNAQLTGADGGGTWSQDGGNPSTFDPFNPSAVNFSGVAVGDYNFIYTVDGGVCGIDTATVTVTVVEGLGGTEAFSVCAGDPAGDLNLLDIIGITPDPGTNYTFSIEGTGPAVDSAGNVDVSSIIGPAGFTYHINIDDVGGVDTLDCDDCEKQVGIFVVRPGEPSTTEICNSDSCPPNINLYDLLGPLYDATAATNSWAQTGGPDVIDISPPTLVCFECATPGTYTFEMTIDPDLGSNCSETVTVEVQANYDIQGPEAKTVYVCRREGLPNTYWLIPESGSTTQILDGSDYDLTPEFTVTNPCGGAAPDITGDVTLTTALVDFLAPPPAHNGTTCDLVEFNYCVNSSNVPVTSFSPIVDCISCSGDAECATWRYVQGPNLDAFPTEKVYICLDHNTDSGTIDPVEGQAYLEGTQHFDYYTQLASDASGLYFNQGVEIEACTGSQPGCDNTFSNLDIGVLFDHDIVLGTATNGVEAIEEGPDYTIGSSGFNQGILTWDNLVSSGGDENSTGVYDFPIIIESSADALVASNCNVTSTVEVVLMSTPPLEAVIPNQICAGETTQIQIQPADSSFNDIFLSYQAVNSMADGINLNVNTGVLTIEPTVAAGSYGPYAFLPVITYEEEDCFGLGVEFTIVVESCDPCPECESNLSVSVSDLSDECADSLTITVDNQTGCALPIDLSWTLTGDLTDTGTGTNIPLTGISTGDIVNIEVVATDANGCFITDNFVFNYCNKTTGVTVTVSANDSECGINVSRSNTCGCTIETLNDASVFIDGVDSGTVLGWNCNNNCASPLPIGIVPPVSGSGTYFVEVIDDGDGTVYFSGNITVTCE